MKLLSRCHLYGIVDLGYVAHDRVREVAAQMIEGGIDVLQLRAKAAGEETIQKIGTELAAITAPSGVPLIINDHPNLVAAINAQGAHVGQDDLPVAEARALAGEESGERVLIGKSTHSLDQAVAAAAEGADYIGFGPLFATPTKPDYAPVGTDDIRRVHERVSIPIFCIGGIKLENLERVLAAGARRVVIVSGILKAKDVAAYTREAKAMLEAHRH